MTVNIAYADSGDGYLLSRDPDYATARAGGGVVEADTAGTFGVWGQSYAVAQYWLYQAFEAFSFSVGGTETVVGAEIRVCANTTTSSGLARYLSFQEQDWGAALTVADWVTPAAMTGQLMANIASAQSPSSGMYLSAGSDALRDRLSTGSSPLRVFARSDRQANGNTPTGLEETLFFSADESGTANDPALVWTTVPKSTHEHVARGQVRLSDGSWVYVLTDGSDSDNVWLRWRSGTTTYADIATLPIGTSGTDFALVPGMQTLSLVSDASDNLYVIGPNGANTGQLSVRAYVKGAGATWSPRDMLTSTPAWFYDAGINNVVAGWHNAGTGGTIMAVAARGSGRWNEAPGNDVTYSLINCQSALAGTGSMLRGSGLAMPTLFDQEVYSGSYTNQTNQTGNCLDLQVPPGGSLRGYLATAGGWSALGSSYPAQISRYIVSADGTSVTAASWDTETMDVTKDAAAKIRVLALGESTWAVVLADQFTGYGLSVRIYQNAGTSTSLTRLGYVRLDLLGLASMPSASALSTSLAWDAMYDPIENKIWVYYVDSSDARRIMRTSVSLNTYLAAGDEVEVATGIGSAGSVITSLRADRNARSGDAYTFITSAIVTSGTYSTVFTIDAFNQAPTAPTLTAKTNFDASAETTFGWTFNDPNVGDTQSAFEVDINTSTGVDVYDTGKLGTITYVGAADTVTGNNTSITPSMPTGWASGDLLLILASIRNSGTGTVNVPSGWTQLASSGNASVLARIARSGDTAPTVTFANGASNADTMAKMVAFRGTSQDLSTIVHAHAEQLNGSALTIATPALAVTAPKCAIVWFGWRQDDYVSYTAAPAGSAYSQAATATAGDDAGQAWARAIQTSAANVAAGTFVFTNTSAISRGLVLALLPQQNPANGSFTLPADMIANGASYQWRVRTWDSFDATGAWSNYQTFQTSAGGNVTVTSPALDNPAGLITSSQTVAWSVSGTTQDSYRVVVTRTDTSAVLVDTGWVASAATSYAVTGMLSDIEYRVAVTVRNVALVESGTALRLLTPSYSTPETPTFTVTGTGDSGYTRIVVTNPTPTGNKPEATGNRIIRRRADGTGPTIVIAEASDVGPDGSFNDYTAASGVSYQYQVRAVASTGYTDSAWVTGSLTLFGLWISYPSDHAATVVNYPFGRSMRSSAVDVPSTSMRLAGRSYPLVEFGEFSDDTYSIKIAVPFGPDWRVKLESALAFATSRQTCMVRDGRGRAMWCVLDRYVESDADEGTMVTMAATRVDYTEVSA